jgi:hypothetical protein
VKVGDRVRIVGDGVYMYAGREGTVTQNLDGTACYVVLDECYLCNGTGERDDGSTCDYCGENMCFWIDEFEYLPT